MQSAQRAGRWRISLLVGSHLIDDLYQGAVPAMLPFFVAERHFGYVAAAGITLAATLLSSVVQPLFGMMTDKHPLPWLVPAGLGVAGIGVGLSGLVDSYLWTWLAIALSGLGVAAYHPESARLARAAAAGSHVGMSWFSLGGNVGFALAPIIVTPVMAAMGLGGSPLLMIPALVVGVLLSIMLRRLITPAIAMSAAGRAALVDRWGQFARLGTVVILRSIVTFALNTFLAIWVGERLDASGHLAGEAALVLYFGVGAVGTLLGGTLASRFSRVRLIRTAYLLTIPTLAGVALVPGPLVYVFIAATALCLYVPFSLHVTLGQDFLPTRVGTASGVTLGLAVSVGGLAAPAVGALAEAVNLQTALLVLLLAPAASWFVARGMREPTQLVGAQ
ncbi:MFS transporter [Spelaeicoccus albus]|uniref:FSR family fosmidomycin resistance protein-like MFS transporter n=2 Tax=Spelaeicoccus albus TaxID=1280376 RepID=A0A7Z0ABL3_9MICO|nr:MFS transporter [Spelaeicoccus albus]NYI66658.1 FSR family fosmidomycin resistance protein-like MFS transporter [Spelaeicoccus albus]